MSNLFNTVFYKKPRRNKFDLSHDRKFSAEFGNLTPVLCQEVIPSDKFVINPALMVRLAPMLAPVMHQIDAYIHYFFVPNRILWKEWEEFITGGKDGDSEPEFPTVANLAIANPDPEEPNANNYVGSIADYLGVNYSDNSGLAGGTTKVSALPFSAVNKIYNDYYRDENLIDELPFECVSGDNDSTGLDFQSNPHFYDYRFPLKRAWRHDYFTSALPFAQKGQPVSIPIGDTADLVFDRDYGDNPLGNYSKFEHEDGTPTAPDAPSLPDTRFQTVGSGDYNIMSTRDKGYSIDITDHTYVDLSTATSNTINDLRRAFRLQEWLEKNARGGSRYVELLQVHFGVKPRDSRLQRAEYIGGMKAPVIISEVLQTSSPQTENDTPQANMSGHGILSARGNTFSKYVEEHGFIIGFISILPKAAYQQGLHRQWFKFDKFDYYWQEFAHIGEQPIYGREIYNDPNGANNDTVFGYTPRYSEYRFIPSTVHGDFKETLDFWHYGRIFANRPYLNQEFIECNPDKRIFAITDLPDGDESLRDWNVLYCHLYHKITAIRPIPKFGIPSF